MIRTTSTNRTRVAIAGMVAALLVAGCGSDDDSAASTSAAPGSSSTTAAPATSEPATTEPSTTDTATVESSSSEPATTDTATTEPATTETPTTETDTSTTASTQTSTTTPRTSNWQETTEEFPPLSYNACCGSDYEGEPSPPVAADPAVPLAEGIYNVQPKDGADADETDENFLDGVLTLELRPYQPCAELGEFDCSGDASVTDALGLSREAARVIDVPLDESLRVAISGFGCEADQLLSLRYIGDGVDLDALIHELEASYETAIAAPLRAGTPAEQVAADIVANSPNGFFKSDCPSYMEYGWSPSSGPTIIVYPDLTTFEGQPPPAPLTSAAAAWIRPTALEVDGTGQATLYIYAGFSS